MATVTTRAQVIIVKPGQTKHDLLNGRIPFNLFPINWKKTNGLAWWWGRNYFGTREARSSVVGNC